jgi:gas vesicle protein
MSERETNGALLGGAGGAVIGGVAPHSVGGALVGGAVGAVAGVAIANLTRPHDARRHCWRSHSSDLSMCRSR